VIRYALFDVDDTLYPRSAGVLPAIEGRIERYLVERLGLAPVEAASLRDAYAARHGTTLAGLLAHRQTDAEEYLAYVHDVHVEQLLQPDAELDRALQALPWEPVIFTNSDRRHAERVVAALGVRGRFTRIFDITATGYRHKPNPAVYEHVLAALGVPGSACLFADDSLRNLRAAKAWHMTTVWVGPSAVPTDGIDYAIARAAAIGEVAAQVRLRES